MSWTFDAPSGTYRNHALSTKIRRQSVADTQFFRFLTPEPGFGRKRGESVTITRMLRLPLATRVSEIQQLPSGRPAIETKQVRVSQWGYKVPVTEFEQHLTHYDIMDPIQATLREQIALTMDEMAADAFKLTPVKYIPTTTGGTFDTDGVPSTLSNANLSVNDLRRIHDMLSGSLLVPKARGGKYIGILSTRAARGLKNDPEYKEWIAPTSSQPLMDGMLKSIEGFELIESNHTDALADLVGSSTTTGEAVFFGADAAGLLSIMPPEIRRGIPENLGTFVDVGWVGTCEAFLTWEKASLARVVHVTSS